MRRVPLVVETRAVPEPLDLDGWVRAYVSVVLELHVDDPLPGRLP